MKKVLFDGNYFQVPNWVTYITKDRNEPTLPLYTAWENLPTWNKDLGGYWWADDGESMDVEPCDFIRECIMRVW